MAFGAETEDEVGLSPSALAFEFKYDPGYDHHGRGEWMG
jgi:hypothetical protein